MKYLLPADGAEGGESPSVWRVWIEIAIPEAPASLSPRHPPCGGCGLKYLKGGVYGKSHLSPSVWRVWIEIGKYMKFNRPIDSVTLRVEGVD